MPELQNGYAYPSQPMMPMNKKMLKEQVQYDRQFRAPLSAPDEFARQHKKNGLIERLYNGIKNLTGLGIGSKKVKAELAKVESGEISEDQARETIDKYRKSQVNGAQGFGDLMSVGAAGLTYFGLRNGLKMDLAIDKLNKKFYGKKAIYEDLVDEVPSLKNMGKFLRKQLAKMAGTPTKLAIISTGLAALAGGITKSAVMRINRIGAKEVDKKDFNGAKTPYDKAAYKYEKKLAKKERGRNFLSGAINGLMMPISVLGGGFIGAPLYLIGNSLSRYFVANKVEQDKSMSGYVDNLKNDAITNAALAASMAVPLVKKGRFSAVFDKNLKTAYEAINAHSVLKENPYGGKTAYQELQDIIFNDPKIKKIIENRSHEITHSEMNCKPLTSSKSCTTKDVKEDILEYIREKYGKDVKIEAKTEYNEYLIKCPDKESFWIHTSKDYSKDISLSVDEQINALTEANLFAVKFKQIQKGRSGDALVTALKENCPPTFTLEEAQAEIKKVYGDKYTLESLMGVGTVAETYLAKDSSGKEVCIKMLKKGITADKIKQDKEKFIDIINNLEGKSDAEKKYLIKQVEDLANTIGKEVDLKNELEAAGKLVNYTKTANVVKPIEVKDNIYVMEKADGISFKKLLDINNIDWSINVYKKRVEQATNPKEKEMYQEWLDEALQEKASISSKYKDIVLSEQEYNYMIDKYMEVLVEQLYKVDKQGRTLHGDIHPGNIFIDIEAVKTRKGKPFTLIDTGNTIDLTAEQAAASMRLTQFIERADTKDLAKYFIEGADLTESNLTKEAAEQKLEEALNKVFFDSEIKLKRITNEEIINLTSNIMKDLNIMPGSDQMSLDKARQSANESFWTLLDMWANKAAENIDNPGVNMETMNFMRKAFNKFGEYEDLQKAQESRNLLQLIKSPSEFFRNRNNPNYKDRNSLEYLTYHLKQGIKDKKNG